ncbi:CAAX protease family protein [Candidatus Electronema halotolerans]
MSLLLLIGFACLAAAVGLSGNLFHWQILDSDIVYILPFSLFIFPVFLEEAFFRGILIPNKIKEKGGKAVLATTLFSAAAFTLWHPLNALTVNPGAQELFLNPHFLFIVFCLGITCSLSYIFSQSLWMPIFIHWLTVLIWVVFLGGRNLVLA